MSANKLRDSFIHSTDYYHIHEDNKIGEEITFASFTSKIIKHFIGFCLLIWGTIMAGLLLLNGIFAIAMLCMCLPLLGIKIMFAKTIFPERRDPDLDKLPR